ncbi:MAG: hypothetical protein LBD51_06165, partial [Bifidobacteriaceae bacterium]|nr:hypothetical protein [Bifidobacteriaceae bacterium]
MRWRRGLLVALALLPAALLAGVVTARVDHPFGPHEAVYEVTADSQVTVSLGPLGALVMPTPLPGPLGYLGARVEVGPIPADLAAAALGEAAAAPSAAELAGDLEQYGQAYLGIGTTVRHAAGRLALDAAVRAGLWWGGSVAALALALAAAGRARRNQVGFWLGRRRLLAWGLAGAVALCGAGAAWAAAAAQRPASWPAGDPLLAGTPLAGAHLTGRLGQLASLYGRVALNAYQQSSAFYSRAADSVEAAFADQAAQAEARAADAAQASPSPGPGSGSGSGESPGPGAGESPGPGPGGSPLPGAGPGESPSPGAGESSGPGGGEGSGAGESPGPTSGESPGAGAGQSPSASPTPPWLDGPGPYGGLTPV